MWQQINYEGGKEEKLMRKNPKSITERKQTKEETGKTDYLGCLWLIQEWQKEQHLQGRKGEATPAKLTKQSQCSFKQKPEYRSKSHTECNQVLSQEARLSFSTLHWTSLSGKVSDLHPSYDKISARQQERTLYGASFLQRLELSFKVLFVVLYICFWFPECSPGLTYNFSTTLDSHEIFPTRGFSKLCFTLAFSLVFLNPVTQMVKNLPAMQETQVWSLGQEDLLEKEWLPTPVFSPGEFHGQKNVVGYRPWGRKESDMIDRLTLWFWPFHWLSWTWFTLFLLDSVMPPATPPGWGKVLQETKRLQLWKREKEPSE